MEPSKLRSLEEAPSGAATQTAWGQRRLLGPYGQDAADSPDDGKTGIGCFSWNKRTPTGQTALTRSEPRLALARQSALCGQLATWSRWQNRNLQFRPQNH